jgi:hypothetical protein
MMRYDQRDLAARATYLDDEIDRLQALQSHPRAFWQQARAVAELFRTVKPLRRVDREHLWERYRRTCDTTKRRQAQQRSRW